jgi:hypothetical protein
MDFNLVSPSRAIAAAAIDSWRAAQAITERVNLPVRHDFPNRRDRCVHANAAIIVKCDLAVLSRRIPPGDHEHGKAFASQKLHQRVVG